ncbi:CoA-binding protein [Noviherbaspirillum denitrificans]|uniref:CoA-binding protein n=1 Tax=Noviherbaspirillum denitrificans TaxID=1968433 RepID=A0A254T6D0_9BURK|nr:CoA-binding protein [Noviherbaspirillum denitrificans]OWW18224.1 CoA-binding protein [Noviherbaspirillum denitrificans]
MDQEQQTIQRILTESRTIAVVGLSRRDDRPSHEVAQYLQSHGYRIVPVNPSYAGTRILGEPCYATLGDAARAVKQEGGRIDVVDCFRKSEEVGAAVDDAITIGARTVWMQLGVIDEAAAARAEKAGLDVVMDKCIKIEHMQLR